MQANGKKVLPGMHRRRLGRRHGAKVQLLTFSPLGGYLSTAELASLARSCNIVSYNAGKRLHESPFYVLAAGHVSVMQQVEDDSVLTRRLSTRRSSSMRRKTSTFAQLLRSDGDSSTAAVREVCQHSPGGFFTRASAATQLIAKTPARVLVLWSDERRAEFFREFSAPAREVYDAVVMTDIAEVLSNVPFVAEANLDSEALRELSELCSYTTAASGTHLFDHGDEASAMYIVLRGSLETVTQEAVCKLWDPDGTPCDPVRPSGHHCGS